MRKIVQAAKRYKRSTTLAVIGLAAFAAFGCGQSEDPPAQSHDQQTATTSPQASPGTAEASPYQYRVQSGALATWISTVKRLEARETVRSDDYERLFAMPAYRMTYGEHMRSDFNPLIMRNVMEHVFMPGSSGGRHAPKKKFFVANYEYIGERLEAAESLPDSLAAWNTIGRAIDRAYPYVPEFRRPDVLQVHLTASTPQMTWFPPNTLSLDVGLALAAGRDQLEDMVAATLVRSLAPPAPPLPHEAESGREALRSTFRKLHHEGIVNIIEQYPTLQLDFEHPTYKTPDENRPRAITRAVQVLERMNLMLETLLDPDSDTLASVGGSVDDLLRLGRQYEPTGYAMNRMIIDRLGRDRFVESATAGPVPWLQAYQEAALIGDARGELSDMPPFGQVNFDRILVLMND